MDREAYLRNSPSPIVHLNAGRVGREEEAEEVREEIPPTYDSLRGGGWNFSTEKGECVSESRTRARSDRLWCDDPSLQVHTSSCVVIHVHVSFNDGMVAI